ncbi:MAG TPA: hypothetical protein VLO00_13260, partial [Cryobacterium sp.]|nr:hypothetical protein [Cryobacterium sp.]
YGEAFGDDGLWNGSLYVFDQRMSLDFSDHTAVIGRCVRCGEPTKNMLNCRDVSCREQLVACPGCVLAEAPACMAHAGAHAES